MMAQRLAMENDAAAAARLATKNLNDLEKVYEEMRQNAIEEVTLCVACSLSACFSHVSVVPVVCADGGCGRRAA